MMKVMLGAILVAVSFLIAHIYLYRSIRLWERFPESEKKKPELYFDDGCRYPREDVLQ